MVMLIMGSNTSRRITPGTAKFLPGAPSESGTRKTTRTSRTRRTTRTVKTVVRRGMSANQERDALRKMLEETTKKFRTKTVRRGPVLRGARTLEPLQIITPKMNELLNKYRLLFALSKQLSQGHEYIIKWLIDEDPSVRNSALGKLTNEFVTKENAQTCADLAIMAFGDENPAVRYNAAGLILHLNYKMHIETPQAIRHLRKLCVDADGTVRDEAQRALNAINELRRPKGVNTGVSRKRTKLAAIDWNFWGFIKNLFNFN